MTTADWIAILGAILAGASALYARLAWSSARMAMLQQALAAIHTEYNSAEMLEAVKSLWDFKRRHPDNLPTAYQAQWENDEAKLVKLGGNKRVEFIRTTLHFKRRLVSKFYAHLVLLIENKMALPGLAWVT